MPISYVIHLDNFHINDENASASNFYSACSSVDFRNTVPETVIEQANKALAIFPEIDRAEATVYETDDADNPVAMSDITHLDILSDGSGIRTVDIGTDRFDELARSRHTI